LFFIRKLYIILKLGLFISESGPSLSPDRQIARIGERGGTAVPFSTPHAFVCPHLTNLTLKTRGILIIFESLLSVSQFRVFAWA
jgi:hypothetical protein